MSRRIISKVAVIGSGIMGSGIACHFVNIGVEVLLLDIAPNELNEKEKAKGLSLSDAAVRNRIVDANLLQAIKSNPAPLYHADFKKRIHTGNLSDDISKIADVDWIIEVVVERLDIKQSVFEQIETHRTPGTLITSNTSGIPIAMMNKGRSDDFQKHFAVTHFFNPPRYLKLFEVIPGPNCLSEVTSFLIDYGTTFLGKRSVLAKDTPAFIGNRIGIFCIQSLFHQVKDMGLTVEEIDKLTGPVIGRPKSATFRTVDVVGLDTLVHVANGLYENCENDERREVFKLPDFIATMMEKQWLGSKSGQGFYKKVKGEKGKSKILTLDLNILEHRAKKRAQFDTLEKTKSIDDLADRYPILISGKDKASAFYRKNFGELFAYIQYRIPEISDEVYRIDDAMKAGFGWTHGPFEIWDAIGLETGIELIKEAGHKVADWVIAMTKGNNHSFYALEDGSQSFYDVESKKMNAIPGQSSFIFLDYLRTSNTIWKNDECSLIDIGDGVLNVEFHSKMNTIGGGVLQGINKGIDVAEKDFQALVVGNQGANFSAGADIGMIYMLAVEQEYDELNMAIKYFQDKLSFTLASNGDDDGDGDDDGRCLLYCIVELNLNISFTNRSNHSTPNF